MTPATSIVGTELIKIVQSGVNKSVTPNLLFNARQIEYFIAATNATTREKNIADVICDGTADATEISEIGRAHV